jgi:hypothetical protein
VELLLVLTMLGAAGLLATTGELQIGSLFFWVCLWLLFGS